MAGEQDVVLVFVEDGTTGDSLCNLNWFELVTPAAPDALEVPTGLAVAPEAASQINLIWDAHNGISALNVKRATSSGGPYEVMILGPTQTNYMDSNLLAGTKYYYVISAVLDGEESADSAEVAAVPSAPINPDEVVIGPVAIGPDGSGGTQFSLSVENSSLGHNYQVYTSDSLMDPDWQSSSEGVVPGTGDDLVFEIPMEAADTNCFYKLEAWRQ